MTNSILCDVCGSQIHDGESVCSVCGTELIVVTNADIGMENTAEEHTKTDLKNDENIMVEDAKMECVPENPKKRLIKLNEPLQAISMREIGIKHQVLIEYNDGSTMAMKESVAKVLYPHLKKGDE